MALGHCLDALYSQVEKYLVLAICVALKKLHTTKKVVKKK